MSESDFLNKSKIFGSGKQLTKYQEAIMRLATVYVRMMMDHF